MESSGNRTKMVATAQRLFAERGYASVSVDEIAAAAGLTKGAIYYSFKDKRDMFRAASAATLDAIVEHVEASSIDEGEHTIDEIVTGGEKLFDAYEDPRARRLLLIDGPSVLGIAEWTAMQERLRVDLGEHALNHLADAGLIERPLVPMLAHLLFGAFMQGVLQIATARNNVVASTQARAAYRRLTEGLMVGARSPS
jgi:AcrR family transcriptional regulator